MPRPQLVEIPDTVIARKDSGSIQFCVTEILDAISCVGYLSIEGCATSAFCEERARVAVEQPGQAV